MLVGEIVCLVVSALLIALGVHALFAAYHANLFRLRWSWAMNAIPADMRVRIPKIIGVIFLAGGLFLLVDSLIGLTTHRRANLPGSGAVAER